MFAQLPNGAPASKCRGLARPYLAVATTAVAIHVVITFFRVRRSYFLLDDFRVFSMAHQLPLGGAYLLSNLSGHVEPLAMLTHWVFLHTVGWRFGVAQALLIAGSAMNVGMIAAIARRCRTPIPIACICAAVAAVSWTTIEPDRWWTNGVQLLPSTLLVLVAIFICARPERRLTWPERIFVAAAMVAAAGFYNKAVFSIAICLAVRLFVESSPNAQTKPVPLALRLRSALVDTLPAIGCVAAFVGLVAAVNLKAPATPGASLSRDALEGAALAVQFGWLAGVVGLRLGEHASLASAIVQALATDAVCAIAIGLAYRRNPSSIWIWCGLALAVFAPLIFISMLRTRYFGVLVLATNGRYHTDAVLITLAVTQLVFGRAYAQGAPGPRTEKTAPVMVGFAAPVAGAVLLAIQLIGSLHYPPVWDTEGNRRFFESLERSVSRLPENAAFADRVLPEHVIASWHHPWNKLSTVGPVLPRSLRVEGWDKAQLYMDDAGGVHLFSDAPRRTFRSIDGSNLTLSMVPAFEHVGSFDGWRLGRAAGWFHAPPGAKSRIAIVDQGRIIAWADRSLRPDLAVFDPELAPSGFTAAVPAWASSHTLEAVAVIDNRIGIELPHG